MIIKPIEIWMPTQLMFSVFVIQILSYVILKEDVTTSVTMSQTSTACLYMIYLALGVLIVNILVWLYNTYKDIKKKYDNDE